MDVIGGILIGTVITGVWLTINYTIHRRWLRCPHCRVPMGRVQLVSWCGTRDGKLIGGRFRQASCATCNQTYSDRSGTWMLVEEREDS